MAVTYTAEQKQAAKAGGLYLVTIDAGGMSFQGPVAREERDRLKEYLLAFFGRRPRAWKTVMNGHALAGVCSGGRWSFTCDSWPDLAAAHEGAADTAAIAAEFERRAAGRTEGTDDKGSA